MSGGCSGWERELIFGDKGAGSSKLSLAELLFLTIRFLARPASRGQEVTQAHYELSAVSSLISAEAGSHSPCFHSTYCAYTGVPVSRQTTSLKHWKGPFLRKDNLEAAQGNVLPSGSSGPPGRGMQASRASEEWPQTVLRPLPMAVVLGRGLSSQELGVSLHHQSKVSLELSCQEPWP